MNPSTSDYAFLANNVYSTGPMERTITNGDRTFSIEDTAMDGATGFFATAYRDVDTGQVVIAYRGTDDPLDGIVDITMASSRLDIQQLESELFTRDVLARAARDAKAAGKQPDVTLTGHSLGGALAELNAAKFGLRGETFNAYGAAGLIGDAPEGGTQVINHVRAGDPVSAANRHFGEVRVYATADDISTLQRAGYGRENTTLGDTVSAIARKSHSMSNFVPREGETALIGPEGEARYRANSGMIDRYRSDVLRARETYTHALENPAIVGPSLAVHAAALYANRVERDLHELADRSAPAARAAGQGAIEASRAIDAAASHVAAASVHGARAFYMIPESVARSVWGSDTGSAELDRLLHPPRLTDASHPDHAMYTDALKRVHAIDASTGRKPDHMSENLAGALTAEARLHGLSRIDHVVMNDDFSRTFAVQGDMNSPFKKMVEVPTETGISTSIDRSTAVLQSVAAQVPQVAHHNPPTMQQTAQTETPTIHYGSAMGR
ncbi:MAG: XVIPCD domain-containing protein [Luteibacter sp.]|uniref:XVIPCD domain-containing protein n=1 Tax=Luteibacter sp. TaxID=1886636 RepID=UPI002806A18E|nr:XVIPCD domain-containing protein [Luteibacter sp.]MDQ7995297.1 DUF2974 domain-containing protein [Luteibacter sp.]